MTEHSLSPVGQGGGGGVKTTPRGNDPPGALPGLGKGLHVQAPFLRVKDTK